MPIANNSSGIKTGSIQHFALSAAPNGWIKANGALISRTTYAALFAVIGTTYGAGDGSTTFAVPDLRGEFIRSLDDGRGVDSARVLGSAQTDALKAHTHTAAGSGSGDGGSGAGGAPGMDSGGSNTTSSTGSTETRPRNVAMLACIKY